MKETKHYSLDITATEAQLKHILSHLTMIKIPYDVREVDSD